MSVLYLEIAMIKTAVLGIILTFIVCYVWAVYPDQGSEATAICFGFYWLMCHMVEEKVQAHYYLEGRGNAPH